MKTCCAALLLIKTIEQSGGDGRCPKINEKSLRNLFTFLGWKKIEKNMKTEI